MLRNVSIYNDRKQVSKMPSYLSRITINTKK